MSEQSPHAPGVSPRVAVYTDYSYRAQHGRVFSERSFSLFIEAIADRLGGLILLGRLDPAPGEGPYEVGGNVEFVALPFYGSLTSVRDVLAGLRGSARAFRRTLDDVEVVWLLGPHPIGLLFALLALARRRKVILGVRQDLPVYVRSRHPGKLGLRTAAAVLEWAWRALGCITGTVAVGPELAANYSRGRGALPISVSLVRREDLADPPSPEEPGVPLRILSVGRVETEKNPLLLADVLAGLQRSGVDCVLQVCGDGDMLPELEARLEELGVRDRAELDGYVQHEALQHSYSAADVFLHVSWTEGLPQVLLEAFAANLPVVATDVGGIAAEFGDAVELIPAGNAAAACAAVERVATDLALRKRLMAAGRATMDGRTLEDEAERVASYLTEGTR